MYFLPVKHKVIHLRGGECTMVPSNFEWSRDSKAFSGPLWRFLHHPAANQEPAVPHALNTLFNRILDELSAYSNCAIEHGDTARQASGAWLSQWLKQEGHGIVDQLALMSSVVSTYDQALMKRSIEAAADLADIVKTQGLHEPEDWDRIFDWAKEILPSLYRAFTDLCKDRLFGQASETYDRVFTIPHVDDSSSEETTWNMRPNELIETGGPAMFNIAA